MTGLHCHHVTPYELWSERACWRMTAATGVQVALHIAVIAVNQEFLVAAEQLGAVVMLHT